MGTQNVFLGFVPLVFICIASAIVGYLLAKDKGRNVVLWTVLGIVPIVNFVCIWYFVGASNVRVEKKIDSLIQALKKTSTTT